MDREAEIQNGDDEYEEYLVEGYFKLDSYDKKTKAREWPLTLPIQSLKRRVELDFSSSTIKNMVVSGGFPFQNLQSLFESESITFVNPGTEYRTIPRHEMIRQEEDEEQEPQLRQIITKCIELVDLRKGDYQKKDLFTVRAASNKEPPSLVSSYNGRHFIHLYSYEKIYSLAIQKSSTSEPIIFSDITKDDKRINLLDIVGYWKGKVYFYAEDGLYTLKSITGNLKNTGFKPISIRSPMDKRLANYGMLKKTLYFPDGKRIVQFDCNLNKEIGSRQFEGPEHGRIVRQCLVDNYIIYLLEKFTPMHQDLHETFDYKLRWISHSDFARPSEELIHESSISRNLASQKGILISLSRLYKNMFCLIVNEEETRGKRTLLRICLLRNKKLLHLDMRVDIAPSVRQFGVVEYWDRWLSDDRYCDSLEELLHRMSHFKGIKDLRTPLPQVLIPGRNRYRFAVDMFMSLKKKEATRTRGLELVSPGVGILRLYIN